MELRLSELSRSPRGNRASRAAHPGESVAVSPDGEAWFLLNASPEIRQQIEDFPELHPRGPRHSSHRAPSCSPTAISTTRSGLLSLARIASARRLRHRERPPRIHRGQRPLPHASALSRPGHVACRLTLGPRGGTGRRRRAPHRSADRSRDGAGQACPFTSRASRRPIPRTTSACASARRHRGAAWRTSRRRAPHPGRAGRPRPTPIASSSTAPSGRATSCPPSASESKRAEDMAHLPVGGREREPGRAGAGCAPPVGSTFTSTTRTRSCATILAERKAAEAAGWEIARDGMEVTL